MFGRGGWARGGPPPPPRWAPVPPADPARPSLVFGAHAASHDTPIIGPSLDFSPGSLAPVACNDGRIGHAACSGTFRQRTCGLSHRPSPQRERDDREEKDEQTTLRAHTASSGAPPIGAPSAPAPVPPPSTAICPDCLLTRRSKPVLAAPGRAPDLGHAPACARRRQHLPAHRRRAAGGRQRPPGAPHGP